MRLTALFAAAAGALALAAGAAAVVGGSADGAAHPSVGMLLVPGADGLVPECSGVLVAPRVFLTAGHCTEAAVAAGGAAVAFGSTIDASAAAAAVPGAPVTEPGYGHDRSDLHDLGVVLLDRAAPVAPASLPAPGTAQGAEGTAPVSVGYGYVARETGGGNPRFVYDGVRHAAAIPVVTVTGAYLKLLDPTGTSLCFGDSGGPQFAAGTSTVLSVTSGGGGACKGAVDASRLDTPSARSFVSQYLP